MFIQYNRSICLHSLFWNRTISPLFSQYQLYETFRPVVLLNFSHFGFVSFFSWGCVNSSIDSGFYPLCYFASSLGPRNWVICQGKIFILNNDVASLSLNRMDTILKVRLYLVTATMSDTKAWFHWECYELLEDKLGHCFGFFFPNDHADIRVFCWSIQLTWCNIWVTMVMLGSLCVFLSVYVHINSSQNLML